MGRVRDLYVMKKARNEKLIKGYNTWDLMDMNEWFLDIIPRMLKELKEKKGGYPASFEDEWVYENRKRFSYDNELTKEEDHQLRLEMEKDCLEKWHNILDKMVFLFNEADPSKCSYKNKYDESYRGSDRVDLWTEENNKIEEYQDKCLKEAMELLAKHFRHLWY